MKRTCLALCLLLLLCGCSGRQGEQQQAAAYKTLTVSLSDQVLESNYAASLEGQQMVEIRPQVSGTITKICFNEGDLVHKGQTLFILDQIPYQAALQVAQANEESAKSQLSTAKLTAESNQVLFDRDVISAFELQTSKNALASAEAALAQAQAQVKTARNNLSYTVVRSPVDGVAGMIPYRVGALVSSAITQPLVTVSDDSRIYAYFSMSENQTLSLIRQHGSQERFLKEMPDVELLVSDGERYPEKGRIDAVSGIVDAATGSVRMRACYPNPDRLLRSGGTATVVIPTVREDCIVIPQTATYEIQERVFVFKVEDGKAVSAPVKVFRLNNGSDYVVESGLEEGDVIIAEGAGLVREGTEIKAAGE